MSKCTLSPPTLSCVGLSGSASANGSSFKVHTGQSQRKFCKELNCSYSIRSILHMSPPLTSVTANPPMILLLPDLPHTLQGCLTVPAWVYFYMYILLLTPASTYCDFSALSHVALQHWFVWVIVYWTNVHAFSCLSGLYVEIVWLLVACCIPFYSIQSVPVFRSKAQSQYFIAVPCNCATHAYTIFYILFHPACMCAQVVMCCEPVPIVQCREDAMPFSCVPWKAIFLLLSILLPRWRAISLTQMMMGTQPCTWQPILVICLW